MVGGIPVQVTTDGSVLCREELQFVTSIIHVQKNPQKRKDSLIELMKSTD